MSGPVSFLVVEDEVAVRRTLVRGLGSLGKVEGVGTCASARQALNAQEYDGMVVDVHLPDGSGLDLLEAARERWPRISLLVVTGWPEHSVIGRALEAGARFLLKPCGARHLAVFAEEAIARRGAGERRTRRTLEQWASDYHLTPREMELLALGAQGVTRESLGPSAEQEIRALLQKTGDDTFEGAVTSVLREAVAEPA